MDTWCPASNAYGACSNTQSSNRREGVVSAIGNDSSAGAFIGKHHWISVIRSWFWAGSRARRRRSGRRWAWRYLDGGIDGDLALLLAVRSQHDGIDWDRFAAPPGPSQLTGPCRLAEYSDPTAPSQSTAPSQPAAHDDPATPGQYARGKYTRDPAARGQYEGIDWDCARDQGERVP